MKMSPMIFVLGVLHVTWNVPVEAEPRFGVPEFPQERKHLGFVLAQGPSGEHQAALPEYTRDQGLLDGELAAEFKGTKRWWLSGYISGLGIVGLVGLGVAELKGTNWWWLSGHLIGYGIMGLVVQNEFFAGSSDAPLSKEAYQTIRGKGNGYVEGFRDGYHRRIRERREASNRDGSFWGIGTVTGVLTAGAILMMVD